MTPYERDPRTDGEVLREQLGLDRQILPPLSTGGKRLARRLGAVLVVLFQLLFLGAIHLLVEIRFGASAMLGYGAVVLLLLALTWRRTPAFVTVGVLSLFFASVAWLIFSLSGNQDSSEVRRSVALQTMPFRMVAGFLAILQLPPPTIRRLWNGQPFHVPDDSPP